MDNKDTKVQKTKTRIRNRIFLAFSAILFFSFFFTAIIFNVAIRFFNPGGTYIFVEQTVTDRFGLMLFILVSGMFAVSMLVAYFLSKSITEPIEKLGKFALGIGRGDFNPNDFEFQDIELEDLNAALNKSVKQLGVYDSSQKDFFQNASHELRTPLMSIKVYAEGIVYGVMDSKKAGETILEETDRLSELVTDLLYIGKIDNITTVYTTEKVDLKKLIKDSAGRQEVIANRKNISFIYDFDKDDLSCLCVPELITRAFDNLVSNAIRYAKSEITLSCKKLRHTIQISVKDDGSGINHDILPHVFERFYKGKGGNTGIGLSIVKSIVNQHNGAITASNSSDGGAIFTMTLPNFRTKR